MDQLPISSSSHVSFHFHPKGIFHALKLQYKPVSQGRTVRRLALKKNVFLIFTKSRCSWWSQLFLQNLWRAQEFWWIGFPQKLNKSAKPSFSPSTTDPDGESSYRTAHFFRAGYFQTADQPRKKRLPMKEPCCGSSRYKPGFIYHHQDLNSNSRSWNAALVCHLHIWMREIKLQLCSSVNLFFQSQIWTLSLILLERRPHAGAGWHYAMTGSPHALADPSSY